MSDLISRKALIEALQKDKESIYSHIFCYTDCMEDEDELAMNIEHLINNQPTVEAKEVVHAEWKLYRKQKVFTCTNCSFERNIDDNFGAAIFCPNCGADMRKKV